jgi:dephospho-CoA kinase
MCDQVMFVDAPKRLRLKRLAATRGWSRATLEEREKRQKGIDYKRRNADIVIRNDASRRTSEIQVRRYWKRIQTLLQ